MANNRKIKDFLAKESLEPKHKGMNEPKIPWRKMW